ncbi:MAG: endonuclease/exonuclease/phosphatase family protein [Nitriliruptoraceae bacterium]|nr:endonuclease/exonuclease/phosphatase family protein [Nitriliruptoraceae bacterium]
MVTLWTWNVNGLRPWDELASSGVDVALLQEVPAPPADWPHPVVPDPAEGWATAGWRTGRWSRRTAVVQVSDAVRVEPRDHAAVGDLDAVAVPVSRPGTLAVADIHAGDAAVTVASMYGGWDRSADPRRTIYADAAVHRLLSDLASMVTGPRGHRLIAAGDLNVLHRYGEHGDPYWAARYATVFDRAESMGLRFVGPQAPNGRQADPRPDELPEASLDVPTYHTRQQGPAGATRQLDFVFVSDELADRVRVHALNEVDDWGPSDHCRIQIEVAT